MDNEIKKNILSKKYLEVMTTMCGYHISENTDPLFFKIKETINRKLPKGKSEEIFSNREINARILSYPENQIKQLKGKIKFSIDPIVFNEILETANLHCPTVLFICAWPAEKSGSIIFSREAMSLICTSYWYLPTKKTKMASANKLVNIEIANDQILDEEAFEKIFDNIYF